MNVTEPAQCSPLRALLNNFVLGLCNGLKHIETVRNDSPRTSRAYTVGFAIGYFLSSDPLAAALGPTASAMVAEKQAERPLRGVRIVPSPATVTPLKPIDEQGDAYAQIHVTVEAQVNVPAGAALVSYLRDNCSFVHDGVEYRPILTFEAQTSDEDYTFPSYGALSTTGIDIINYSDIALSDNAGDGG